MKAQSRDEIRRQRLAEVLSEIRRQQLAKTLSEIRRQQALVSENSSESDSEIFLLSDKDRELKVEQGWNECVERRRKDIQNQVLQPPDRYTSLMVISEGLDTHIIESLGCLFDVDPECFVGHITGLSYGGVIAPRPEKWHTSDQSRSHLSLEWYSVWTVENTHFESEEQDDRKSKTGDLPNARHAWSLPDLSSSSSKRLLVVCEKMTTWQRPKSKTCLSP